MKYNCYVKHNGVLYAPGTDVPEGKAPIKTETKKVEPKKEEPTVEPEFTRTQIQQMNSSDLRVTASKLDIEYGEDATNRELKQMIFDKLGM